jgi:hypothetical protein
MANVVIRFLWTIFIGSWLVFIWYVLGFIFTALIFTSRIGFWFFDNIEYVYSLHGDEEKEKFTIGKTIKSLIWFIFVGWWLGLIVIAITQVLAGLIITIPVGWWLINRIDKVILLE